MNIGRVRKLERLARAKQEKQREAVSNFLERAARHKRRDRTVRRAAKLLNELSAPSKA